MFSGGRNNDRYGGGIPIPSLDATSPYNAPADLRRSPRDQPAPMPAPSPRERPVALDPSSAGGYPSPPYPPYGYPYPYPTPYGYTPYLSPTGMPPPPAWPWPAPPGPPPGVPATPYTPGHPPPTPYGYPPPHPGYAPPAPPRSRGPPGSTAEDSVDKADKWSRPAEFRAPSLGLAELGFLAPKAVEINPLITVGSDKQPNPALDWNLAFPPSTAKKAGDESNRALSIDERQRPATWPAIKKMTIVLDNEALARWEILVIGNSGGCVTIGDVLAAVHSALQAPIHPAEWEAINSNPSTHVRQYYKRIVAWANFNRSADPRAPGGHLAGNQMQRIDFLCANTIWGGLKVDPRQSRSMMKYAQSGYWIFRLELLQNGIGEGTMPPPGRGAAA